MIEQLRRLMVGLALAGFTSCGPVVHPQPPSPPTPPPSTDPSPICPPVGAICGCYFKPPGQEWQQLPPCEPVPPPNNNPPPMPLPTGCVLGTPGLQMDAPVTSLGPRVNAVLSRLSGCSVGSRCILIVTGQQWQAHVEQALRDEGLCAGQHEPRTDEIAVSTHSGGIMEAYKVFAGDDSDGPLPPGGVPRTVVWFPGGARVAYLPPGGVLTPVPPAAPTPTPPASGACGNPLPPKVWTAATLPDGWGQNEIGRPRWMISCGRHGKIIDCVAKVEPRACDYCASIGMGTMPDGVQPRCGCPVRQEGDPERVPCEAYLTGGTRLEARNGATCAFANSNPFQFEQNDGNCRLCSSDGSVCSAEWF